MKITAHPASPMAHFKAMLFNPLTLAWVVALAAMIVLSLTPHAGITEMESGFGRDKLLRALTFIILSFYPAACFPSFRIGLIVSTCIAPLGFMLELVQKYVPGRHFSPEDMIANNIGAILGIALALALRFFFHTAKYSKKIHFSRLADVPSAKMIAPPQEIKSIRELPNQHAQLKNKRFSSIIGKIFSRQNRRKLIFFLLVPVLGYMGWSLAIDYFQPTHVAKQSRPINAPAMPPVTTPEPSAQPADHASKTATPLDDADAAAKTIDAAPIHHEAVMADSHPNDSIPATGQMQQPLDATPYPAPTHSHAQDATGHSLGPSTQTAETTNLNRQTNARPEPEKAKPLFSVRVGAFLNRQNAENLIAQLESKGYHPYLFTAADADNHTWHAVQLSDHENLDQAAAAAAIFKNKENRSVYITHKNSLIVSESAAAADKKSDDANKAQPDFKK